jgi:hypothetical protein
LVQQTKTGKIYQNGKNIPKREKYTKLATEIPNDHTIYQNGNKNTKCP